MATGGAEKITEDSGFRTASTFPDSSASCVSRKQQAYLQDAERESLSFPPHWSSSTEELVDAILKVKGATIELHETVATIVRRLLSHDIALRKYVERVSLSGTKFKWVQISKSPENSALVQNALMLLYYLKSIRLANNPKQMTTELMKNISGYALKMTKESIQTRNEDPQFPSDPCDEIDGWDKVKHRLLQLSDDLKGVEEAEKNEKEHLNRAKKSLGKAAATNVQPKFEPLTEKVDSLKGGNVDRLKIYRGWLKAAVEWKNEEYQVAMGERDGRCSRKLAQTLEHWAVELLEANGCVAANQDDEWLKIRNAKNSNSLLEAFDAVAKFNFALEHDVEDMEFSQKQKEQISAILQKIVETSGLAYLSKYFTSRIGWWKKFVAQCCSKSKVEKQVAFWLMEGITDQILKSGGFNLRKLSTEAKRVNLMGDEYDRDEYEMIAEWRNPLAHGVSTDQASSVSGKPRFEEVSEVVCKIVGRLQLRCIEQGIGGDEILEVLRVHVDDCIAATKRNKTRLSTHSKKDDGLLRNFANGFQSMSAGFDSVAQSWKSVTSDPTQLQNKDVVQVCQSSFQASNSMAQTSSEVIQIFNKYKEREKEWTQAQQSSSDDSHAGDDHDDDESVRSPPQTRNRQSGRSGQGGTRQAGGDNQSGSQSGGTYDGTTRNPQDRNGDLGVSGNISQDVPTGQTHLLQPIENVSMVPVSRSSQGAVGHISDEQADVMPPMRNSDVTSYDFTWQQVDEKSSSIKCSIQMVFPEHIAQKMKSGGEKMVKQVIKQFLTTENNIVGKSKGDLYEGNALP